MVRVRFSTNADRGTVETVADNTTVREYLMSKNARMDTKFYSSGCDITGDLDETVSEVYGRIGGGDVLNIYEVAKTTGA